ncbi:8-oxo-dGTP diphosphatase [Periweissella fabalis]|uniref:8-oxo-dGTP diphosphatase n=1 Tax=Periweissella fabalis TaxID=1070421 RepID=A0A7X6S2F5_9LACO|nr:8-oxo-dGTP diphosphatase [Periweissella fabalis]MCM0599655.1 8-oxo-dGTP diphosphatase [Periweissella fabalis]NKZ23960.1 8-oxo-dGTP diphosphatase [Periweissella fabalis]
MTRYQAIEITNMIMIEDLQTNQILVEDRKNPKWPGVTFPDGHVELNETIVESAYREVYEETGLTIYNPKLVGIKEWPLNDGARYIVFLFKATEFSGEINASKEGDIFWTTRKQLDNYVLPKTFKEMLPVFDNPEISALALKDKDTNGIWQTIWQ